MGHLRVGVRAKVAGAAGPMAQPALARAAKSNVRGTVTARLRRFIIPPREFRRTLRLSPKRYADGRNYVPKGGAYSRALWLEGFVQGALAVAFEVEGDVGEACVFERLRDGGGHFGGQRAGHFFRCDFDARELVVQAHAELLEAEMAEGRFAALDEAETLGSHFGAVGHARGETRGGGPVPGGEPGAMRKMANFGFAQAGVEEGREHAMFFGGAMAGAEVEGVVGVDAIGGGGETGALGRGREDGGEAG